MVQRGRSPDQKILSAADRFRSRSGGTQVHESPTRDLNVFAGDRASQPLNKRSSTPFSLDKPLPKLPESQIDDEEDKSLLELFEGYLDAIAFMELDNHPEPTIIKDQALQEEESEPLRPTTPLALSHVIQPAPSEDEWLSSRHHSRPSTAQTPSDDEPPRRGKSTRHASFSRGTSASAKTVTPMSSIDDSDRLSDPRGLAKTLNHANAAEAPPIIDEVSEPETCEPGTSTPRRGRSGVCSKCGHVEQSDDTPQPQRHAEGLKDSPMTALQVSPRTPVKERDVGPSIVVKDSHGRRYALYPRTSYYEPLQETEGDEDLDGSTPDDQGHTTSYDLFPDLDWSSPVERPGNPDPYAPENSPSTHLQVRRPDDADDDLPNWVNTGTGPQQTHSSPPIYRNSPSQNIATMKASRYRTPRALLVEHNELEEVDETEQSFWKNPEGVIVVYQGVELDGKEEFYGSDINYLGSYYDDDEGSSGLGSHRASNADLAGTGSGLAAIPEGPGSDELWEEEALAGL